MISYVVVFLIDRKSKQIYYLKKDRPNMYWLHNKLVGWGGKLEKNEDMYDCAIRELKEELNLDIKKEDLEYKGKFYDGIKGIVYVMNYYLEDRLKEGKIENEGYAIYKPYNYHKTNPDEFPKMNLEFQDLIFEEETFELNFNKNPLKD